VTDPDVRPHRPRLRAGVAAVPVGDGIIFDGGPKRQHFGGRTARDVLPRLLSLLDGTHDEQALARHLDLPLTHVRQLLQALEQRDLLVHDELARLLGDGRVDSEVIDYLCRSTQRGRYDLVAEIATLRVAIATPDPVLAVVATDLVATGAQMVAYPEALVGSGADVVLAVDTDDTLRDVVDACARSSTPVVRCRFGPADAEVGPVFLTGNTACLDCLRRGQAQIDVTGPPEVDELTSTARTVLVDYAAAAVTNVVLSLRQVGIRRTPHLLRAMTYIAGIEERRFLVTPFADCPMCGIPGQRCGEIGELVQAFEWQHQASTTSIAAPTVVRAPLGRASTSDYATSPRRSLRSTDRLDRLLSLTCGLRREAGETRRWTPTGGDLGSVDLFLLRERDDGALPGNVFRLDATTDSLIAARADPVRLRSVLAGTGLDVERRLTCVVFVGSHGRLASKYGTFGYRLTHLDAGCAVAQFELVARHLDYPVSLAAGWTSALPAALELDGRREFVCAVLAVS
jgi:SagB-type dehydrogenase family enzyme